MGLDMERLRRLAEAGDSPAGYMTPAMALYLLDRLEAAEVEVARLRTDAAERVKASRMAHGLLIAAVNAGDAAVVELRGDVERLTRERDEALAEASRLRDVADPPMLRALVAEVDALRRRVADGDESARGELLAALDALDAAQAEVDRARGQRALQSIGDAYETLLGELGRVTRERDEARAQLHSALHAAAAAEGERDDAAAAVGTVALMARLLTHAGVPAVLDGDTLTLDERVSVALGERDDARRAFGEAWAEVERLRVGMAKSNEMAGNIIMDLVTMLREATGRDAALDDLCRAAAAAWREAAGGSGRQDPMKHNDDGRTVDLTEARCVPAPDPLTTALEALSRVPLPPRPSVAPPGREPQPRVEWRVHERNARYEFARVVVDHDDEDGEVYLAVEPQGVPGCTSWHVRGLGTHCEGVTHSTYSDAKALAEAVFRLLHAAWLRSREVGDER